MRRMNVRSFEKIIREAEICEEIFINAINLSEASIEKLREFIQDGTVSPWDTETIEKYANSEDVKSGKVILPQMTYIKGFGGWKNLKLEEV